MWIMRSDGETLPLLIGVLGPLEEKPRLYTGMLGSLVMSRRDVLQGKLC